MSQGLQIFDGNGNLKFDTNTAKGGVCLDIVTIPSGGMTYIYPGLGTGYTPQILNSLSMNGGYYSYSEANGYPSFTFPSWFAGATLALFIK